MAAIRELHYRLNALAGGAHPGQHRSRSGDGGFEFRGHALLQDAPDARRLDLHASLRDPYGQWIVRRYSQRKAVAVAVVADLSASMGFEGVQRKLDVLAEFTKSLAWSAWRSGDSFCFVGCDEQLRPDFYLPPSRHRGAGLALAQRVSQLQPQGRSARALSEAHGRLPRQRALVFLVSDFHLPWADLGTVLASLAVHDVVPVVLWQAGEFELGAVHGLAQVQEPESGLRQWLWWRAALRERWRTAHMQRREALLRCFRTRGLRPLFIEGAFDADAVTRHFRA